MAQTVAQIPADDTVSYDGRFKVPTGYSAYIQHLHAGGTSTNASAWHALAVTCNINKDGTDSTVFHNVGGMFLAPGTAQGHEFPFTKISAGRELKISTQTGLATGVNDIMCHVKLLLVAN